VLAVPLETLHQDSATLSRIVALVRAHSASEVVVGHPISLSGQSGAAAHKSWDFAEALAAAFVREQLLVSVRLVDERLTTVSAERILRQRGRKGARQRAVVDQAAAVVILQHALDAERSTGQPAGQEVGQVP
jgi:putative Holliday junction resolvase